MEVGMAARTRSRAVTRVAEAAPVAESEALREDLRRADDTILMLEEAVADLERAMLDPGWTRLTTQIQREFQPEALRRIRETCRVMALASPLLKRGLSLRASYVFGGGVEVQARADGRDGGEQDVNAVVQAFLDDPGNRRAMTGTAARRQLEHALGTDGEVLLSLWTKPVTGRVQVRVIVADELADIIHNPDDASEPWYYLRRWNQGAFDPQRGVVTPQPQATYHPAVGYRPTRRPSVINGIPVRWDAPCLHVAVNVPLGWTRGVPDAYAAIDWARAYRTFLEDWARLVKSLSKFAWRLTAQGQAAKQAKTRLASAPSVDPYTRQPLDSGGTAITPPGATLEAIPKTGATIDSESGRPLAMMVAAALGVPVTMLLGDPGLTGSRATAETLDTPTELEANQRRELWADADRAVLHHVITEAVRAPKGALKGAIDRDEWDREVVTLAGNTPDTIDITWPDLDEMSPDVLADAIVKADSTGTMPPEEILRLLLKAFGYRAIDEMVARQIDEEGNFIWPTSAASAAAGVGGQAVGAARNGQDPATVGTGSMTPDEPADGASGDVAAGDNQQG